MGAETLDLLTSSSAMKEPGFAGLELLRLDSTGVAVTGTDTPQHRIKNKCRRKATLANQAMKSQWTIYQGEFKLPPPLTPLEQHHGEMRHSGLALLHPVAELLKDWATYECPTYMGKPWTQEQMQAAVDQGPHCLALSNTAIAHFRAEVNKR